MKGMGVSATQGIGGRRRRGLARIRALGPSLGFTLLELMISLSILGVIVLLVFGALRIGIRAWEKGEMNVEDQQKMRIVADLIKRQMASACVFTRQTKGSKAPTSKDITQFQGDSKTVSFISRIPLAPGNQYGFVYVKYIVKPDDHEERIAFFERNMIWVKDQEDLEDLDISEFYDLMGGVFLIEFSYLKRGEKGDASRWQEKWDSKEDKGLPLAVRVVFQKERGSEPITVIARIQAREDV